MATRYFALVYGVVFLLVGIAGFIPAFVAPYDPAHPELMLDSGAGLLFGLFPVNLLHNLTHAAFGVWGILAWRSWGASRAYAKAVAVIYGLFVVMGLIPGLMTVFGLVPLHGHDIWLHLLLAAVAAYFGFAHKADRPASAHAAGGTTAGHDGRTVSGRGTTAAQPGTAGGSYATGSAPGASGAPTGRPGAGDSSYTPGGAATPSSNTAGTSGAAGGTSAGTNGTTGTRPTGNGSGHRTNRM